MDKQSKPSERLASLEAKVGILLDLLKEIRDDLKNHPSRDEYNAISDRVELLDAQYKSLLWKVALASGGLSVVITIVAEAVRLHIGK